MRIAVYHNLPSGGAKRALYEQVRRLSERHEIDVYTLSCAEHAFCDLRPFASKYRILDFRPGSLLPHPFGLFDHGVRAMDILRLRSVQRIIAGEINRGGYDLAWVNTDHYTQSPIILQFLQIPSVYYCQEALRLVHDPPLPRPYTRLAGLPYWADRLNLLHPLYLGMVTRQDKTSMKSATLVLVNSYFSRETVYRLYSVSSRVCYLGIDTHTFRPLGLAKDNYVMSVGALAPHKGFDFLITSIAQIPKPERPALLLVSNAVNQAERSFLENLAHVNQVQVDSRVLVQDAELVGLFSRARITLYAPVLEPFGFVPLESMACATPVIGVAEGGVRETIRHGETGLLTDRDPQRFAGAIVELLDNPSLAGMLGRQGVDYVREHWSWEDSVVCLESHMIATANKEDA